MIVNITRWMINQSRVSILAFLLILFWGLWSYSVIPVSAEPEVVIPIISVTTQLEGAAGEDMVSLVTRPLEEELIGLEGLQNLHSYSRLGVSVLIAEFDPDFDVDQSRIEIERAVDSTRSKLPDDILDPVINEYSTQDYPLLIISVTGPKSTREIGKIAKLLQTKLESISEVDTTSLVGIPEEVLHVELDKFEMENYNISPGEVYQQIISNNALIPLGVQSQESGTFEIKIDNIIRTYEDVMSIPIKSDGEALVKLVDVADIRRTFKTQEFFARVNGVPAVAIEITKAIDANDIDTSSAVENALNKFNETLPPNVYAYIAQDQSNWARSMVNELQGNIGSAVAIVMTLIVAMLGFKSGILIGLSVPFCFLFGFGMLNAFGFAFNFMVMFGLLLSMGMLIDCSVVIIEFAQRGKSQGLSSFNAYMLSVKRMHKPIFASVGTTILAFVPLMLWPGVTGHFMRYLPTTVFSVLFASLILGLFFIPVLGYNFDALTAFFKRILGIKNTAASQENDVEIEEETIDLYVIENSKGIARFYSKFLKFSVANPIFIVSLITILSILTISTYSAYGPGTSYFTDTTPNFVSINVRSLGNLSPKEKQKLLFEVEQRILNTPDVKLFYLSSGGGNSFNTGSRNSDQIGYIFIELVDHDPGVTDPRRALEIMQENVEDIPGIIVEVSPIQNGPPIGSDLQLNLISDSYLDVGYEAERLKEYIISRKDLGEVTTSIPSPRIEWLVKIDKARAAALGVDTGTLGFIISMATQGVKAGEYRPNDSEEELDIIVKFSDNQQNIFELNNLNVPGNNGLIPVTSIVSIEPVISPGTITRRAGGYHISIGADVSAATLNGPDKTTVPEIQAELEQWLKQNPLRPGVTYSYEGAAEELGKTIEFLLVASIVAIVSMFLLIVAQFNSFYQSLIILSAVALSFVGVFLMLLLTNTVLSVVLGGMGLVTLAGIVVNNNIVLVDTYNYVRKQHPKLSPVEWASITGMLRFRPIMLTTLTTILGLLPLAFSISLDIVGRKISPGSAVAEYWTQLASTLVSGLTLSGILTLIFTPAALVFPYALRKIRLNPFSKKPTEQQSFELT